MPRLVRRRPLLERLRDYLNPGDFLLWLSEWFETSDWDTKQVGTPIALGLHVVMLIARANSGSTYGSGRDDVFGDNDLGSSLLSYVAAFIVHVLTYFSIANAIYTFFRKRHYRLFESPIETPQSTPSAHRVRVDSSPVASSPLRFLSSLLGDTSADSRAHPDPTRDVWELALWDPLPVCLRLFCLFSPGHVLVYWLFLPTLSSDPRPSITIFTTLLLQTLMSSQLFLLQTSFSQQEKDSAIIHKEVMSEYDIKFVHPRLNPLVRDVGTQYSEREEEEDKVDTYTPTVVLQRGVFKTNPNPNYAKHVDPENKTGISLRTVSSPSGGYTPSAYNSREPTPFTGVTARTAIRQPQFRQSTSGAVSTSTSTSTGDGGSLGVFTHSNSPLKKATSMYDIQDGGQRNLPRNSAEMARREIQDQRERSKSPVKRQSDLSRKLFGHLDNAGADGRRTSAPGPLGEMKPRPGNVGSPYQRGPARW
ncbi:hypothetical protein D0Z07_4195 [Hyphodiscus hymeniophilus]|uniref:Meiotically up-regulated gene 154 protein n=1 Tax=Hyphodiscus hymeniophilus TaxID=353542 RepID=A0A9P6VJY7_9HELO|nr:hypothetical protein D0Z07_4195 [Hyphodiscus hymeniophilus]